MEILSPNLKKNSDDSLKRYSIFSMDYDSGYISHNLESNLDSYIDDNRHSVNTVSNRPIYLSEDALLETPEVNKYSNISLEIEKEDFEETRNIFSSPPSSVSTTEVPASVGSREISYSGFDTEESNTSIKIPCCKQIIVDNISEYNSPDFNMIKRDIYREQQLKNLVFNNITNTLTFNDAKKKLTLIFSKDDKENVYSVKRKYPSLTPDKSFNSDNSFSFPTPKKFVNVSNIELNKESESINDSSLNVSNLDSELKSKDITQNDTESEENFNSEGSPIVPSNNTLSTSGEPTDLEISNNEKIGCFYNESVNEPDSLIEFANTDQFSKLEDKNCSINIELGISEVININVTKETVEDVSYSELKSEDINHNDNEIEETFNNERNKIVPTNDTISTSGEPSDLEISNNENIECSYNESVKEPDSLIELANTDQFSKLEDKNCSINIELGVSKVIDINSTKETVEDISCSEFKSGDIKHNDNNIEDTFNSERSEIVPPNHTISTSGEPSDLGITNNENIEKISKSEYKNSPINLKLGVSELIGINVNKGNVEDISCSINICKTTQENEQRTDHLLKSLDNDSTNSEIFKGLENEHSESNKIVKTGILDIITEESQQKVDINNFVITSTPEKPLRNPNISNLSPDLFTDDIEESIPVIVPIVTVTPKEKNIVKKDYMILRRTQNNLKGVIPPRSLTTINISVTEMLKRIENNTGYFWKSSTDVKSSQNEPKSMLITCPLESCKNKEFPDVLKDRSLGLYYNRSKLSEEFEELCGKYGQRYVGMETQSSCTVFETNAVSPTKRRNVKPQWNLKSPGKRLSHLARRRITFSSANLQLGNSFSAGSRARQILVDAKSLRKIDLLGRRRSPRKSPRKTPKKTPAKSPRKKTRTPSSSAKKKLAMRFRKVTGEIEKSESSSLSAKRTLFHSPDESKKLGRLLPSTSGTLLSANELKTSATKRALFMSPSKSSPLKSMGFKRSPVKRLDFGLEKKRKRVDSQDEPPSKIPRCQSDFAPSSSEMGPRSLTSRTKSDFSLLQNRQTKELTTNNKKKLQLAVYEALRSQNVLPTHPQFKVLASNLGRLTKKLFLPTSADCVGVTEKMLRIARHHVIAVVKGKSVEEIYEDYMKNKSKNVKPQGYIAPYRETERKPQGYVAPYRETERKPIPPKGCFNSDSKVERIRKAINFGDDDNS